MKILKPYRIELAKTLSQHWYHVYLGKRKIGTYPSSTTILNAYPQSPQLTKWIAEQGWSESQKIKSDAGERGTRIHSAIELLLGGGLLYESTYSLEEWVKICAFVEWYHEYKPEIIEKEMPIFSKKYGYAGRLDCIAKVNGEVTVIDWKSSQSLHGHFPLQFASYAKAVEEMTDLKIVNTAVLQMGAKNKNHYKFVVYPDWCDHLKVFLNVKKTWEYDSGNDGDKEPPVLDLPAELKL